MKQNKSSAQSATASKYSARYWDKEIQRAKKAHEEFVESAKESIKAYSAKEVFKNVGDCERRRNVWWYVTETLLPAYFSRTPKAEAELRKREGSPIYQLAARALEREVQYGLDEFFDFDAVLEGAARALLLTGRSVLWCRYEAAVGEKRYTHKMRRSEDGIYYPDGTLYDGDEKDVAEDGTYNQVVPAKEGESAILECINYQDFLTGPGRAWDEVEWRGRKAYLTEDEFQAKFGKPDSKSISFNHFPADTEEADRKDDQVIEGKACIYEIWCEASGKVYYRAEGGSWMESEEPPLKFPDFYPCDVLQANATPDSVVPVSDWEHVKDQVLEVEQLTTRKFACLRAIRSNFAYDSALPELKDLLTGDLKGIPVKNWPSYKQKGGLASATDFLNVDPHIKALEVINLALNEALQGIYETTKAADILRGMADPRETATAVEIRSDWGSMGLRVRQRLFARHISNAISKLGWVIASKFSPERQWSMMDIGSMQRDLMSIQATPEQLIAAIQDDTARNYALTISSDSMVIIDERAESQDRAEAVEKIGGFLQQSLPFMQQFPSAAPQLMALLEFVTRTMRAGKDVEPIFVGMFQAVMQDVQQQKNAPPPPDPMVQVAQIEAQTKQQQMQIDMQLTQAKAQAEMQRIQIEREKFFIEAGQKQAENQLKLMELQLKAAELNATISDNAASQALDAQRVQIEGFTAKLGLVEKFQEEKRLSAQAKVAARKEGANGIARGA